MTDLGIKMAFQNARVLLILWLVFLYNDNFPDEESHKITRGLPREDIPRQPQINEHWTNQLDTHQQSAGDSEISPKITMPSPEARVTPSPRILHEVGTSNPSSNPHVSPHATGVAMALHPKKSPKEKLVRKN
ncbi:predicted protein [Sclerotinia sclerotiorum 1980 UF-70]|uniref:Uncharacterized protein n=1 Tax=Sclerotinia sclerotiorum (strain ATCC 18683 / 1980 / Ss-1) TaxID=665079 RepID=A7F6B3_SCLS1|nr:predicted protein [Sclerotinia sclerotiorum 1980 UF-70]EDN98284.1 predicted protein [Sclerotinia sclerotiorum 1980 UF-70]